MIYLLRHGETVWNRAGRLQGRGDSPLTRYGVELAIAYGEWLSGALPSARGVRLHTSPMTRARQTAALVAEALGLDADSVCVDARLAEHDVGSWSGLSWREIERDHGASPACLQDWDHRPPHGETRREMLARARDWLSDASGEGTHVVVSHGGLSRALRGAYLALDVEAIRSLPTHTHGRLFELRSGVVLERIVDAGEPPAEQLLG